MKKFVVAVAVVALVAFSAPVFASTNPFMDVPMNHWAYDAIGQLAAHGILSGYPDGTYKGKQPTTRYEMASALARALAVVDMTKASKQDVEMLKKLVVEFKDELEALGVRVDDLDERVKVLEDRLGGWKLSGVLRLDIRNYGDRDAGTEKNDVTMTRARLFFDRWFGEDESIHFRAILRGDSGNGTQGGDENWKNFYVDIPFFFDSTLTVGRFTWDMGADYYLGGTFALPATGGFAAFDSILTDRDLDAVGWTKQFGLGSVRAYVAHPKVEKVTGKYQWVDGAGTPFTTTSHSDWGAWELFLMAQLQFTEQFGFDLGAQAFFGDNADLPLTGTDGTRSPAVRTQGDLAFKNMWTAFAGLRFDFNEHIGVKALYYRQKHNDDYWVNPWGWREVEKDSANHWRFIVNVDQELLKFTSLWLEYGQMDQYFVSPAGLTGQGSMFATSITGMKNMMRDDLKYWRVALGQQWNEKWATHLFYFHYDFDGKAYRDDLKEWGLGVQYTYNPNVQFGLNFVKANWGDLGDDHIVKFRTQVTF